MEGFKQKSHFTCLSESDDLEVMVASGRESVLHWIWKFIKVDCFLYTNPKDSWKYYKTVLGFLIRSVKKRHNKS